MPHPVSPSIIQTFRGKDGEEQASEAVASFGLMPVMAVSRFERLFRLVASLDVDKHDLKRCVDFVNQKLYELLLRGEATAKANGREVILPCDLPVPRGLQECMHQFSRIDEELELKEVLAQLSRHPRLDLDCSHETGALFPEILGGLSVALARSFKILEPGLKNSRSEHWERSIELFGLLL